MVKLENNITDFKFCTYPASKTTYQGDRMSAMFMQSTYFVSIQLCGFF